MWFFNIFFIVSLRAKRRRPRAAAAARAARCARRSSAPVARARPWAQSLGCGRAVASLDRSCLAGPMEA